MLADLEVAMRVLLDRSKGEWKSVLETLIRNAHMGDAYRAIKGVGHPEYGSGTLMSAAQPFSKAPRPVGLDRDALAALGHICRALIANLPDQTQ